MDEGAFLRRRLVLPMGGATVACLGLAYFAPAGGLFLSLALLFLGILITVGYVDVILREHERRRWVPIQASLHARLESVANVTWSQFRVAFGMSPDIVALDSTEVHDDARRRAALVEAAEGAAAHAVRREIARLDTAEWKRLAEQLRITWQSVDRMLEVYGQRLAPVVLADLMTIQDALGGILTQYSTFPDVLGVEDDKLPPGRGHNRVAQRTALEELAADDAARAIEAAVRLLEWIQSDQ